MSAYADYTYVGWQAPAYTDPAVPETPGSPDSLGSPTTAATQHAPDTGVFGAPVSKTPVSEPGPGADPTTPTLNAETHTWLDPQTSTPLPTGLPGTPAPQIPEIVYKTLPLVYVLAVSLFLAIVQRVMIKSRVEKRARMGRPNTLPR